jgi:hypothetical protein
MPSPQVNDRLKEIPAQVLRTVFATIGQLLLAADRLRARVGEQLSGSGEATAAPPAQQAPAEAPQVKPAAPPTAPAQDAETTRWRSLDKTGNVRVLNGDEEQDEEDLAVPATPAVPAPAGYTPTEPVPAVSAQAEPVSPGPALDEAAATSPAGQAPADLAPAVPEPADITPVPDPADLAPTVPAPAVVAEPSAPGGEALPVPNYDQLSVASLRARLRVLDATQVQVLLDYEKAHESRPAVITMFERRITKLSEGS